jgi:hypothetical protein
MSYSIPSKELRGFFENEALLNKFSGKKLQLEVGQGCVNFVWSLSYTPI